MSLEIALHGLQSNLEYMGTSFTLDTSAYDRNTSNCIANYCGDRYPNRRYLDEQVIQRARNEFSEYNFFELLCRYGDRLHGLIVTLAMFTSVNMSRDSLYR